MFQPQMTKEGFHKEFFFPVYALLGLCLPRNQTNGLTPLLFQVQKHCRTNSTATSTNSRRQVLSINFCFVFVASEWVVSTVKDVSSVMFYQVFCFELLASH